MKTINQKYEVKATVVSPLSIGQAGEKDWVEGIDYIRDEGILYHLNLEMMANAGIPMQELSALYASGRIDDLRRFLTGKLEDIYDFSMEMPVGSANPVKTFYFNPVTETYVLFGSSLKGAIRSAVFHELTRKESTDDLLSKKKSLDRFVFGEMKDGTNFMRFIRIGDFDFDETGLVNTKIYNLQKRDGEWLGGWKHQAQYTNDKFNDSGFNTVYECLMPGAQADGFFMVSPLLYNLVSAPMSFKREKDALLKGLPICQLFTIINEATLDYLKKEITFFKEFPQAEYSDRILSSLNKYREMADSFTKSQGKECLIKMSAGSGFHSITGDWQYNDFTETDFNPKNGKKNYKSRKIACYKGTFTPMGFLRLSI